MLKIINSALFIFLLISCNHQGSSSKNIYEENEYSFDIPKGWELIKTKGIDSRIGYLLTNSSDTIFYEYGNHSEKVVSNLLKVLPFSDKDSMDIDNSESIFRYSSTPYIDQDLGIFLNEFYIQDTINTIIVKIQIPKFVENGTTALYSDEINEQGKRLVIKGKNLNQKNHDRLIDLFKSIKFKDIVPR